MYNVDESASPIRIFVLSNYLMFARGLESLLSQNAQLQIVGHGTEIDQAIEQIRSLQPDVVILDSSGFSQEEPEVMSLFQAKEDLRVLGLSLQDNSLYIYQATQKSLQSVDDLLTVINDSTSPDR